MLAVRYYTILSLCPYSWTLSSQTNASLSFNAAFKIHTQKIISIYYFPCISLLLLLFFSLFFVSRLWGDAIAAFTNQTKNEKSNNCCRQNYVIRLLNPKWNYGARANRFERNKKKTETKYESPQRRGEKCMMWSCFARRVNHICLALHSMPISPKKIFIIIDTFW